MVENVGKLIYEAGKYGKEKLKNIKCIHFWEIGITTIDEPKPTFKCMHCGKTKQDNIPILDPKIFDKLDGE